MARDDMVVAAKKAIDRVFFDTSVPQEKTRDRLKDLAEHIESLLETLPQQ